MAHADAKTELLSPADAMDSSIPRKRTREEDASESCSNHSAVVDVDNLGNCGLNDVGAGTSAAATDGSPPSANPTGTSRPSWKQKETSETLPNPFMCGSPSGEPRRLKQPTLAAYGMVSEAATIRKEISDRDALISGQHAQIGDLTERVAQLEAELAGRGEHVDFLESQTKTLQDKLQRFRTVLWKEMRRTARLGRAESRRVLHQRHFELGQMAVWPVNGQSVWVEGNVMRELIMQLAAVSQRREEAEALKKSAHHLVRQLQRDREDSSNSHDDVLRDAMEEFQLRASEVVALSNKMASIHQRRLELDNEKKAFTKEIRRVSDEDASDFVATFTIGDETDTERYVLMYLLGKGGFSEVWRAFDLVEGRYVACKIHHINRNWSAQTRQHYQRHAERELEIMRQLDHPHLTRLYDVFQLSDTVFVSVMEYSKGMDMDTYLKTFQTVKENDSRLITVQVVSALRYLASLENPIIHYDLKPANILLHSKDPSILEIKITDFGLAKIIGPTREGPSDNPSIELTSQGTGTYWYLPPECFETASTPRISNKVDVWSVGIILYQMLYGRRPFAEGQSQRKIWQEKLIVTSARTLTFPDSPKVTDEAKDFISRCLTFNVAERYDIFQLGLHPFICRHPKRAPKPKSIAPSPAVNSVLPPLPSAVDGTTP